MSLAVFKLRGLAVLPLALCAILGSAVARAAPDAVSAIGRLARDLDLQTAMPKDEPPSPSSDFQFSSTHWHIPGDVASWVLYGALAIGLAFALYALRDTIPGLSRRRRLKPAKDAAIVLPTNEAVERMAKAGNDADDLARQGRFAEAMHVLLLRSVSELRRQLDVAIGDALTSREIHARLTLPDLGRGAFGALIRRVERVHFGDARAEATDYAAARTDFQQILSAMQVPAAA